MRRIEGKNLLERFIGHQCVRTGRNVSINDMAQLLRFSHSRWFPHSGEMVSRHFHTVLQVLPAFANEMIKPLSFNDMLLNILKNIKNYPWFKEFIVVIDWTHIYPRTKPFRIGLRGKTSAHRMSWLSVHSTCITCGYCLAGKVLPATGGYSPMQRRDRILTFLTCHKVYNCILIYIYKLLWLFIAMASC